MDTKALDKPVTSKDVERRSNAHFQSAAACLTGYRPSNEDAHVLDLQPKHATVGVFDGHGGPRCAAYLAKHVPPLVASLGPPVPDQKLEEALVQMDQKYVTTCTAGAGGSTAAFFVAMPRGDDEYDVQVANVGDSRVLIGRPTVGGIDVLVTTKDHKPDDKWERDRIVSAGGKVRGGRVDGEFSVSRAFGDRDMKKNDAKPPREQKMIAVPDLQRLTCRRGDVAVVACDGLFETDIGNEEALRFVQRRVAAGGELGEVACALCELAVERGSKDNVTCAVVLFGAGGVLTGPATEFLPGPDWLPHDEAFRSAYRTAASRAGLSLDKALELRRRWVEERIPRLCDELGIGAGGRQPDYAAWGEQALAGVLRAEGQRASCDVAAMAEQCRRIGEKEGRVLEPPELRALREELVADRKAPEPAPAASEPAAVDSWGEEAGDAREASAKAEPEEAGLELPETDDWEDFELE